MDTRVSGETVVLMRLAFLMLFAAATPGLAQSRGIRLSQVESFHVPSGIEITGASLSADGAIVFWSQENNAVWISAKGSIRPLCSSVFLVPTAAAFIAPGVVEIVDRRTSQILRVNRDDTCNPRLSLPQLGPASTASYDRTTDTWAAVASAGSQLTLVARDNRMHHLPTDSPMIRNNLPPYVRTAQGAIVVSNFAWPFEWNVVSSTGKVRISGRPFANDIVIASGGDTSSVSRWFGLAVHSVGDGFIQVVADPRSDARFFILYGADGLVRTIRSIDLSIGILDFDAATDRLLAMRRTDGLELVTYKLQRTSP